MTQARTLAPSATSRLATLVNQPGGLTAAEAVRAADAELAGLRPRAMSEIAATVSTLLAACTAALHAPERDRPVLLRALYPPATALVGSAGPFGYQGVGVVAYSLCSLVDRLENGASWSAAALRVHRDALRLAHRVPPSGPELDAMACALAEMVARSA